MKKVLASLLVLVSFASFGGVVSFADNTFNESNYWKHAVNTILYPKDLKCANFDVCLKMKADETRRLTNGKFDFDISPFLGSDNKCVKEFNDVNSKWFNALDQIRYLKNGLYSGQFSNRQEAISKLNNLENEENKLYYKRFDTFLPCLDKINHEKSMDLFRALCKVSIYSLNEECQNI